MAKSISQITRAGFVYNVHEVSINHGKDKIGTIEALAPTTFENLAEACDGGLETEAHALALYSAAKAIELQRMSRSAKTGGKMPSTAYDEIYNSISAEQHAEFVATGNAALAMKAYISQTWAKQSITVSAESEDSEDA